MVMYIAFNQFRSWCVPTDGRRSDLSKQLVDYLEYSKFRMVYSVTLCVQMIVTFFVTLWAKNATTYMIQEDGTLPFDDRVYDLVKIMWVLFGLHALQFAL